MFKLKSLILFLFIFQSNFLFAQRLKDSRINELSGLVVSSKSDDLMWVHNDSGDISRIFLINKEGKTLATFNYNKEVRDCEDIALNTNKKGITQLYVGDIGDNRGERSYVSIYKFEEPNLSLRSEKEFQIKKVEELKFQFPDGPRDAECLMIDSRDQKIYIVSKREDKVGVYSAPLSSKPGRIITLKKECSLFFDAPKGAKWITAGDISSDGKVVLIKSYINIYYWDRKSNETIPHCISRPYIGLPYNPEPQGESVGLTHNGRSYYSISEGKFEVINFKKI
jgi:hypothetical protein